MDDTRTEPKTCDFEPCGCELGGNLDYCAPTCRLGVGDKAEPCKCGHAGCEATVGEAAIDPQ